MEDLNFTNLQTENWEPPADLKSTVLSIDENPNIGQKVQELTQVEDQDKCSKRIPKRILHFSDGTLEEFSTDDESDTDLRNADQVDCKALVDPATLTWGPYVWYQVAKLGSTTLSACDYLGEHLANFFGITSPKYQFEVNEYFKMKAEEEEEKKKQDEEAQGWKEKSTLALVTDCGGKQTVTVETVAQQPHPAGEAKESFL